MKRPTGKAGGGFLSRGNTGGGLGGIPPPIAPPGVSSLRSPTTYNFNMFDAYLLLAPHVLLLYSILGLHIQCSSFGQLQAISN